MAFINSIATAVPPHRHEQGQLLHFMQEAYESDPAERRKLGFMFRQSQIDYRHSAIADFGLPADEWTFFQPHGRQQPGIEARMEAYLEHIVPLAKDAAEQCISDVIDRGEITHLVTVTCTGLAAPGLDLLLMEAMNLPSDIDRSTVNFMGCYAAVHGLKAAVRICAAEPQAKVLVVCAELCTLHFQDEISDDNISSSLLFADGAASLLVSNEMIGKRNLNVEGFHSHINAKGRDDMAWTLGRQGFLMKLSSYVPQLIEADIDGQIDIALRKINRSRDEVKHWCIHPGGKKILELIEQKLNLSENALEASRSVLRNYGNMSSPTVLFVLKELLDRHQPKESDLFFGAAFGPGLTMETFTATMA